MSPSTSSSNGSAFSRPRAARIASAASIGVLVGFSLLAASPAAAAPPADCLPGNTVDSTAPIPGTAADIQTLLYADEPLICLIGEFSVAATLRVSNDVTFYGFPTATLRSTGLDRIILANNDDDITVENLRLTGARASGWGGAISGYAVTARNSTFDDNTSDGWGGAIMGDKVTVESSVFTDNHAMAGGAIASDQHFGVEVRDSTFTLNSSTGSAGAVFTVGPITLTGSTFEDNTTVNGGAALQSTDLATISNSTFVRNTSSANGAFGGGLLINGGTVTQSTFLDNAIPGAAGGQAISSGPAALGLLGNIFASLTPSLPQVSLTGGGTVADDGGNVFSTTEAVETYLSDPDSSSLFAKSAPSIFPTSELGNYGGLTPTLPIGENSPARGAVLTGTLAIDQRGVERTSPADAGAFEWEPAAGPQLAATGAEPGFLAGVAAALLAAGAVIFGGRRRVRRTTSRS